MSAERVTPEELAEVHALDAAATPGPWWQGDSDEAPLAGYGDRLGSLDEVHAGNGEPDEWIATEFRREDDARFTARMRTLGPKLAREVERLTAERDALREKARAVCHARRFPATLQHAIDDLAAEVDKP